MSTTKHAPDTQEGWRFEPGANQVLTSRLAIVCSLGRARHNDEARLFAERGTLLAAAPDLLAACRVAVEALEYIPVPTLPDQEAMDTCRAAIAKAEGGQS